MKEIKKVQIEKEIIYLTKDSLGWRVISPIKNEDGSFNLKNLILGNKRTIAFTLIWLLIMAFILFGVNQMISQCRDFSKYPCKYTNLDCSGINTDIEKINNMPIIRGDDRDEG